MKTIHRLSIAGIVALTCSVVLASCGKPAQQPLPTGTLSFTGSLVQAELSLTRSGTHILRQNGKDLYYVESNTVNLNQFDGMDVTVRGHLERNADPTAQPVIVADAVTLIEAPSRPWTLPALNMSFSAPLVWQGTLYNDGISFTETGTVAPVLKIYRSSLTLLPSGTPLVIGDRGAVQMHSGSGDVIYVQNGNDVVAIEASPALSVSTGSSNEQQNLETLLKSIVFTSASSTSFGSGTLIPAGTGSTAGMPCGGPAGILCPTGSFCSITDPKSGIGVCHSLSH